jgi:class 3 adenylate cyclase
MQQTRVRLSISTILVFGFGGLMALAVATVLYLGIVAGAVGAAGRLNYTVHGDTVNLAARLEQMNKEYGTRVMASQGVVDRAPDTAFRRVAEAPVRGRSGTETVYTLDDGES